MDATLILHAGKWLLGELLRLEWNKDRETVAAVIAQLVQLQHSLVHELDGKALVLARGISAPDEILILLYSAATNRLSRPELREYAQQKPHTVTVAISRLIKDKYVRSASDCDVVLTPSGQAPVLQTVLPQVDLDILDPVARLLTSSNARHYTQPTVPPLNKLRREPSPGHSGPARGEAAAGSVATQSARSLAMHQLTVALADRTNWRESCSR